MKRLKRFAALSLCGLSFFVVANEQSDFQTWLVTLKQEAKAKGFSDQLIKDALDGLKPYPKAIKSDRAQPEFKKTFKHYSSTRLSDWRINTGLKKKKEHHEILEKVGKAYGVQPRFILAFWGLETNYGTYTGNNDIIRSLATLAYDKRRGSYFRKELFNALTILKEGHIALKDMKGSWSGAMGQGQFMPSSFLKLAQDFDGDGKKDIWNTPADVFASIANYLKYYGWDNTQTWGRQVTLPEDAKSLIAEVKVDDPKNGCRALNSHSKKLSLSQWNDLGVRRLNTEELPHVSLSATLSTPDGAQGEAFLTYNNFRTILRYNCANSYAITVGLLSDKLK